MGDSLARTTADSAPRPKYRVRLLTGPRPTRRGIEHGDGELLEWSRVERAIAAEVGEPEGVRTIVFDLVLERSAAGLRVQRLDADPGEDAMELARAIEAALGPERATPSIKSVATDGIPSRRYADLEGFEADALERLLLG